MNVIFRTDASLDIGIGHVMRCLTLAQALSDLGANCRFICREHTGNLLDIIRQRSFEVQSLSIKYSSQVNLVQQSVQGERVLPHAAWLGVDWQTDAEETKNVIGDGVVDWLIVDHYALDIQWENYLKPYYKKLMVIDDLADRNHCCDLLLDQTYGRDKKDYLKLTPPDCELLLGSQYALLRPEFSEWREYSLKRRTVPKFEKLLITLGGVDPDNITGQILDALKGCDLPKEIEIIVVLGSTGPHKDRVQQQVIKMPYKTIVKIGINNMAEIMANADIAIGASGSTTWERCCLGLPSIQVVLAENQNIISESVRNVGASLSIKLDDLNNGICDQFKVIVNEYKKIAINSSKITNGMGVFQVLYYLK